MSKKKYREHDSDAPWNQRNDYGESPGDICCCRSAGTKCYEHDYRNYPDQIITDADVIADLRAKLAEVENQCDEVRAECERLKYLTEAQITLLRDCMNVMQAVYRLITYPDMGCTNIGKAQKMLRHCVKLLATTFSKPAPAADHAAGQERLRQEFDEVAKEVRGES